MTFIYTKKPGTSKKARQFALRFLMYKKPDTLCYTISHGIFEIGGGGGEGSYVIIIITIIATIKGSVPVLFTSGMYI